MEGTQHFIGKSLGRCDPQYIDLQRGDFFVIASDGIRDIRASSEDTIENSLRDLLDLDDLYSSILAIEQKCNGIIEENRSGRTYSYMGGRDNISVLLVYPEQLSCYASGSTVLLGGWNHAGD